MAESQTLIQRTKRKSMKKSKQGGKRKGAGAKLKYGEATTPVVIRVPTSKVAEFRLFVNLKLKDWLNSGI